MLFLIPFVIAQSNSNCTESYLIQDQLLDEACGTKFRSGEFNKEYLDQYCNVKCINQMKVVADTLKSNTCSNVTVHDLTASSSTLPSATIGIHMMVENILNCAQVNNTYCMLELSTVNTTLAPTNSIACGSCYKQINDKIKNVDFSAYPPASSLFSFWLDGKCVPSSATRVSVSFALVALLFL
jgi:hypothetical protein